MEPVLAVSPTDATLGLGGALLLTIIALAWIAIKIDKDRQELAKQLVTIAGVLAGVFGGGALGTIFAKQAADDAADAAAPAAAEAAAESVREDVEQAVQESANP